MKAISLNENHYCVYYPVGSYMSGTMNFLHEVKKVSISKSLEFMDTKKPINIWCRGSSGAILSALFCSIVLPENRELRIIHLKKPGETSHSTCSEFTNSETINIVIDDFIETGFTLKEITSQIPRRIDKFTMDYLILSGINNSGVDYFEDKNTMKPKYLITSQLALDKLYKIE